MCIQHCQRKGRPPSFCSNVLNGNYHSLFAHAWDTLGTLSLITGAHKMILGRLQGSHSLVFVSHGSRTRISRWFVWYSLHPYSSNSPVERSPGAKRGLGCSSRFLLARGVGCGNSCFTSLGPVSPAVKWQCISLPCSLGEYDETQKGLKTNWPFG